MSGAVFSAEEAAEWTGGSWRGVDSATRIDGVFTDSRKPAHGALYIAIRGERFDGHDFVRSAVDGGACAVMANASVRIPDDIPALIVEDTEAALTELAAGWRAKVDPEVVGVTGSVGKTTVKELTAHLLGAAGMTAKTLGNWNNSLGLPQSILAMEEGARFGVFEIGMNHPGELAPLVRLMQPDCAVVTNVGPVHIEFFADEAAIADEKAELLRAVPENGFAVLDADSPHFAYLARQARCRVVTVSLAAESDFKAEDYEAGGGRFMVREAATGVGRVVDCGLPGAHQVVNALEAIAVARQFGIGWDEIAERFQTAPRARMRWEKTERDGVVWINDAYNANPVSMAKSVETFARMDIPGRKVAVLGDMFELGSEEETLHRRVGGIVAASGLDFLITVGVRARWIADSAEKAGMDLSEIFVAADVPEAKRLLGKIIRAGDGVLIKASRGMALEAIMRSV